jgi:hypothetical protein
MSIIKDKLLALEFFVSISGADRSVDDERLRFFYSLIGRGLKMLKTDLAKQLNMIFSDFYLLDGWPVKILMIESVSENGDIMVECGLGPETHYVSPNRLQREFLLSDGKEATKP